MHPLQNIDRASWLVLAGVAILTIVGIGATLLTRTGQPAADLSTPSSVVTTYVRALQAGDADRAWALLAPDVGQATPEGPKLFSSRDSFRQQVQSSRQPTTPRVRILSVSQSADTATVHLEASHASGNPLTGASTQQVSLTLARQADGWRITADPMPWQFQ